MPQFRNLNIQFHEVIKTSNLTQNEFFYPLPALTWFRLRSCLGPPSSAHSLPRIHFQLVIFHFSKKIEGK